MKTHTISYWGKHYPKAYISNGFIGFRIGKNAFSDTSGLLAGFNSIRLVDALAAVPAPRISFIYDWDELFPETLSQSYDFSCGEFTTNARLTLGDHSADITYTLYCNRTSPTLLHSIISIKGDIPEPVCMRISCKVDDAHRDTVGTPKYFQPEEGHYDGKCLLPSADGNHTMGVAYRLFGTCKNKKWHWNGDTDITIDPSGTPLHIITSYVPGVMHSEPHNQAHRTLGQARWIGIENLRENNRKAWAELWKSRIVVDGAGEKWQEVIDASFFYLMSSASPFAPISVPPFALSDSDHYFGHCFWDTESFMLMPPMFCAPDIARSMLEYRSRRRDAAENNARLNGYQGIMFPWESGISGSEVTIPWASTSGELHINLDVAMAFDGFVRIHGEEAFLKEKAWPIIRGVCEWIESRVTKTARGYEIHHVTGIAEGLENVNNDAYTNIMSARVLRAGCEYSAYLGLGKRPNWMRIAENMYVPYSKDGIMMECDPRECDPEGKEYFSVTNMMAFFPYGHKEATPEAHFKNLEYYVYNGMEEDCIYPMLSGFLGIFPAWIGDRKTSLKFYELANLTFFSEPFYSCTECSIENPEDRIEMSHPIPTNFITGRGSLLSGLIMGLTKICPWKGNFDGPMEDWFGEDIILPEGWNKVTIGRVYLRGKAYRVEAEHGAKRAKLIELEEA